MAEETWFVAMDGRQLEGARPLAEVREIIRANAGKRIVVWNEKMTGWADPATLPAFKEAAAPPPSPAAAAPEPPATAPPPRREPGAAGAAAGAVAAAVAGSAPAAKEALKQDARFFRGLLDFKFEEFITPKVIRTLYIVSLVFVALGFVAMVFAGIGMIFMGARFGGGGSAILGIVYLVLSPVFALLQATFLRMFFELVLVLFRIKDAIVHIEEKS